VRRASYLLLALLLAATLTACASSEDLQSKARQDSFISEITAQNQQLRDANAELRRKLIEVTMNESRSAALANACLQACPAFNGTHDLPSPIARVPISDVLVSHDQVILDIPDVQTGVVAASKSMDPFLDKNTVVLEVPPKASTDIKVGDIIIYELQGVRIVHRVVSIDTDESGWFATTKGDNNPKPDPDPVRFSQVKGIVVGVIY
jgi:hypothetical protein